MWARQGVTVNRRKMYSRVPSEVSQSNAEAASTQQARIRPKSVGYLRVIAQMGRMRAIPALLTPVLWGASTARWQSETISIWWAAVLVLTYGALALACNYFGAYVDYLRHIRAEGQYSTAANVRSSMRPSPVGAFDGFDWMQQGLLRPETFLSLGLISVTIYVLAALWLGIFVGWPVWFFALISGLMCSVPQWPVVRFAGRFWWLGDLAFWLGLGVFPLLGTYFVLTGTITRLVLLIAFAPATFAWLAYQSYSFYSWRRDWRLRRRTLAVVFGPERGLDVAAIIAIAGFIALILLMATGAVPVWTILVLGAFPLFLRAFTRARVWPFSRQAGIGTVENAINAVILAGMLWLVPMWLI